MNPRNLSLSRVSIVWTVVCVWLALAANVPANYLSNGGFESNGGSGSYADYWANSTEAGVETWAARSDSWGMAMVTWRGDGTGYFYQDLVVDANVPYVFSVWAVRDGGDLTGGFYLKVEWYDANGLGIGEQAQSLDIPSDAWAQQMIFVTAPSNAVYARAVIGATNINRVGKFDDAVFSIAPPAHLTATGQDSRIDLRWDREAALDGYNVYRSDSLNGLYTRISDDGYTPSVYSDFVGTNGQSWYYCVTARQGNEESAPSDPVSATSRSLTDDELLTSVQEATFRYFWDYGHPVSGLALEGYNICDDHTPDTCAAGGTGFGLMAICVGAERGFVTREQAAERVLKMFQFLDQTADRYHGAWSHWINGTTGDTIPFTTEDNGGDLVETAFLMEGILTARSYFDGTNAVETEIRDRASSMWGGVDWCWYLRRSDSGYESNEALYWHWSPDYEWTVNVPVQGFNEAMIVYLLAIASPTHPVPASCYYNGWAVGGDSWYANGKFFYNYLARVGYDYAGPLFFNHYSFMGFDPRNKNDRFADYFENGRNLTLIDRAYCAANPKGFAGYSDLAWGLTASFNPWGYGAHQPWDDDNGTITPSGALGSMPYTPEESLATLKYFYQTYGANLWGPFGFVDSYNLGVNWFAPGYVAIDQGPIIVMIENYRSQLCWNKFMANTEIQTALDAIGWVTGKKSPNTSTNVVAGLNYEYYEGYWTSLPDFDALTPTATGWVTNYDLSPRLSDDCFAFRFRGYIDVPTNGGYTFYLSSDDGSQLFIGDRLVVDNDGAHAEQRRSGYIALEAGRHAITVTYFEQYGGETLTVSYVAQDIPTTAIPDSVLCRELLPEVVLEDGFETSFDLWTGDGTTDWDRTTAQKYAGTYSAHCGSSDNDLISDNLDTSAHQTIKIEFWYRDDDIDDGDDVYLQLYNGSSYVNRLELGITSPEDTWHKAEVTLQNSGSDAQYFHSQFRIKFEGSSIDSGENLWIDDVKITVY